MLNIKVIHKSKEIDGVERKSDNISIKFNDIYGNYFSADIDTNLIKLSDREYKILFISLVRLFSLIFPKINFNQTRTDIYKEIKWKFML